MHKSGKISIIAVPIKFNEIFWGILEGSSYNENFFAGEFAAIVNVFKYYSYSFK
jgi:hypothetical protein